MRKTPALIPFAAATSLGLIAACAGITQSYAVYPRYSASDATYAAADRDLKVIVLGNPTALPKDRFESAVALAMQGKNFQHGTRFTVTPGASWRADYRVVVAFGAPANASGSVYCRYAAPPEPVAGQQPIRMVLAFCDGEALLSEVLASTPSVAAPGELDRLMADTLRALMPAVSPGRRGN